MQFRFRWFVVAFSMVLALAPFSGIVAAALLATVLGCQINDAAMDPCHAYGMDFTALLSDLTLTASLGRIVFLIVPAVLIGWAAVEAFALLFRRWRTHPGR